MNSFYSGKADHLSGGRSLSERTGAQYCLHRSADVSFAFTPLTEAQELDLGNVTVKVVHTPGHTDRIAFVEKMATAMPPRTAEMESILRANQGRA